MSPDGSKSHWAFFFCSGLQIQKQPQPFSEWILEDLKSINSKMLFRSLNCYQKPGVKQIAFYARAADARVHV